MKNIVFFIVFFSCLMLIDNSCKKENSNSTSNPTVAVLYEKSVDPAASDVTVELPNKISIVIPQGVVPNGTVLKISELASNIPKTNSKSEYQLLNGFMVELGSIKTFSKPLRISFPIPDNYLNDPLKRKRLRGAYFSPGGVWTYYPDTLIDLVKKTFSFDTKHLTPLGFVDFMLSGLFTNYYSTQHYTIYYTFSGSHGVMSDADYNLNAQRPWHVNGIPDYVTDAGYYLEYADSVYRKVKGLELPTSNNIYIKNTGGDGYYSAFSGCVNLSNTIQIDVEFDGKVSKEQYLAMACAHELFHLAQDYFYGTIVAGRFNMWWMEALATNADAIVYANNTIYESMTYSRKQSTQLGDASSLLHYNLGHSWDDCNADPRWYGAGCFLFYMHKLRSGPKLDMVQVMKNGGDLSTGFYVNLLRDEVSSQLKSTIGGEYVDFIKYLYEGKNQYFNIMNPTYSVTKNSIQPCFEKVVLDSLNRKVNNTYSIPYLACRIIKFNNPKYPFLNELDITLSGGNGTFMAYLANAKSGTITQQVFNGDKLVLDYNANNFVDLILINTDVSGSIDMRVEAEAKESNDKPPFLASRDYLLSIGQMGEYKCPTTFSVPWFYIPWTTNNSNPYLIVSNINTVGNVKINWTKDLGGGFNESCTGSGTVLPYKIIDGELQYSFNITFAYQYFSSSGPNGLKYKYEGTITGNDHIDALTPKLNCTGLFTRYYTDIDNKPTSCSWTQTFTGQYAPRLR